MTQINLLPWREDRRTVMQRQFLVILAGMALLGGLMVLLADRYATVQVSHQNGRNDYIQRHIAELDAQVIEIRELEKRRADLLERMEIIQGLQGTRPVIVRIFEETVRTLPDRVFFRSMTRTDTVVAVKGTAESNNRVSSLMRRLDSSEWFTAPNLTSVSSAPDFGEQGSNFELSFKITTPDKDKEK
jgi:type IV pilus assembly protein PilN